MIHDSDTERMCRLYLLGELPKHQHRLIERRYFEDDELFERLLAAEEKLIADYSRGALAARERQRFETYFLSTERRRQKVKELSTATPPAPPPDIVEPARPDPETKKRTSRLSTLFTLWFSAFRDWPRGPKVMAQLALSLLLLVVSAVLVTFYLRSRPRTEEQVARVPTPRESNSASPTPAAGQTPSVQTDYPPGQPAATPGGAGAMNRSHGQPNPTNRRPAPPQTAMTPAAPALAVILELTPGLVRGTSTIPSARLDPDGSPVLLRIKLPENDYSAYRAELRTEGGRIVRRLAPRPPDAGGDAPVVTFLVPGRILSEDFYYLNLYGISQNGKEVKIDYFPFDVEVP